MYSACASIPAHAPLVRSRAAPTLPGRSPSGTIGDRFAKVGIANSEEARRAYRQMLFEAPGANQYLCAAILDPETLYQRSSSGKGNTLFPEKLKELGIMPGAQARKRASTAADAERHARTHTKLTLQRTRNPPCLCLCSFSLQA